MPNNMTPLHQVKHQIHQILSSSFKQLKGKIPDDQWRAYEAFFWKVRPLVELDYSEFESGIPAETTGPKPPETSMSPCQ